SRQYRWAPRYHIQECTQSRQRGLRLIERIQEEDDISHGHLALKPMESQCPIPVLQPPFDQGLVKATQHMVFVEIPGNLIERRRFLASRRLADPNGDPFIRLAGDHLLASDQ